MPGLAICPLRTPTLPPATHTNCYLVGAGEMIVVDPATPYDDERAELDRALDALAADGRRVVEIWLTHHHLDHIAAAGYLARRLDVPVAAHRETAERIGSQVRVDRVLEHGDSRLLAGSPERSLRAVFTPGHAPGHLCFFEERTGSLIAGDMIAGVGTILVDPSEGDMGAYLDSLRLMKSAKPRVLLPAHGGPIVAVDVVLDGYIAHRLWREKKVVDALVLAGSATPRELVPAVYSDVPSALHGLAERSLLSHLLKLEVDDVAVRDGDSWRLE